MRVTCRLEIPYRTSRDAHVVARSVKVDDDRFIATSVRGRNLVAEAEADSILSLLHTLEDYLACLSVAEKLLEG